MDGLGMRLRAMPLARLETLYGRAVACGMGELALRLLVEIHARTGCHEC